MEEEKSFFERMFDDIGDKIKTSSQVLCWLGIIASIIYAIIIFVNSGDYYDDDVSSLIGWIYLIIVPLGCLFSSWLLYGFGELINKISILERHFCSNSESYIKSNSTCENSKNKQSYKCTSCGELINYGATSCESCGQKFDWSKI